MNGNVLPDLPFEYLVSANDLTNNISNNLSYFNSRIENSFVTTTTGIGGGVIYGGAMLSAGSGLTLNISAGLIRGSDLTTTQAPTQGTDPVWVNPVPTYIKVSSTTLTLPANVTGYYVYIPISATYNATIHSYVVTGGTPVAAASLPSTSPASSAPQTWVCLGRITTSSTVITDIILIYPNRSYDYSINAGNTYIPVGARMSYPFTSQEVPFGWMYVDQTNFTIGNSASSATYANNNAYNLYRNYWYRYDNTACPVSGGRGVSALLDWNANKTLQIPQYAGNATGVSDGGNGSPTYPNKGQVYGSSSITEANLPPHTHNITLNNVVATAFSQGGGASAWTNTAGSTDFGNSGSTGSGDPYIPPTIFDPVVIKL